MKIVGIQYDRSFVNELRVLPEWVRIVALKKEAIFRTNPLHPSLRMHALSGKLEGLWSISITRNYRIIFERQKDGVILFITIGKHDIYRSL